MIRGTIIGEIRIAMIAPRNGTWLWLSPIAAKVPKLTESKVATGAIVNEFRNAFCQSLLLKKCL